MTGKKPILRSKPRSGLPPYWQQSQKSGEEMFRQQAMPPEFKSIHGTSILLVEDSLLLQEITKGLLERAGAKVAIANNGKEALDIVHRDSFDCVLMDIHMPEMDGLEATRLLRADPSMAGLRIVAISADIQLANRDLCFAVGMDDFITKPFSVNQLYTTIAKWLPQHLHEDADVASAHSDKPEFGESVPPDNSAHQKINGSA